MQIVYEHSITYYKFMILINLMYCQFCSFFPRQLRSKLWWYMGENIMWDDYEGRLRTKSELMDWVFLMMEYISKHQNSDIIELLCLQCEA